MDRNHPPVLLQQAADQFHDLILRQGEHSVRAGDEVYIQPYVYLSTHLVQMRAQGWDVDFDQLAALSGASALFAYQPGEFMPKYAHLYVDPDGRTAQATGFGYAWTGFADTESAWQLIVESVDAGRSAKGWDWENILFAGYQDAAEPEERKVFAMADGPDTYAKWLTWSEFGEWVERVQGWNMPRLGRHTGRVEAKPADEVALRVMRDLVAWSTTPPDDVRKAFPQATFGLPGIETYAAACEGSDLNDDWVACHDVNGQWTTRNATSVYLQRVAEAGLFPQRVNAHLLAAAGAYRAAYESWQELYNRYLGHGVPEAARKTVEHRRAGAAAVRLGLEHERKALAEVERALAALKEGKE
jgi:hypothetical protein